MPPRNFEGHLTRLDLQDITRSVEALATRVGTLATEIAVLSEKQKQHDDKLDGCVAKLEKLEKETIALNKIANRALGLIFGLTLIGGAIGTFWEKVAKLWH